MKKSTSHETEKDRELARRIRAAGIPILAESNKDEAPALLIRQDINAYESMVFDIDGGAGLILSLNIIPNIPVFVFSGVYIRVARWPSARFQPLEENYRGEWPHYDFYGRSELKFHRSETINRFLVDQKEVRRGCPMHGLLLAVSNDPLADDIARGEVLHGSIEVFDQFEQGHSAKIFLRVDREARHRLGPGSRGTSSSRARIPK